MTVYGEMLFAENMMIGGVILYLTGEICGIQAATAGKRLRLLAGSILCGLFSLTIFLPVRMPLTLLMESTFAMGVCLVVFGRACLWQKALTFLLVTYFMGGLTMGLLLLTHNTGFYTAAGIYTGDMKAAMLALFIGIGTATARRIIKCVSRKKFYGEHIYPVMLEVGEMRLQAMGFVDTGNSLKEPISSKPVALADKKLWHQMERCGFLREERFCIVPYEGVGGKGLLEAIRLDMMQIGSPGRRIRGCVVAKSTEPLYVGEKEAADCQLLLSRDMMDRRI